MPQMQDNPNSGNDLGTAIILQQLDQLNKRLDQGFERSQVNIDKLSVEMKAYMEKYVLTAVHDLEIKRLDEKDTEQQKALEELEERVISAPQKYFLNICAIVGCLGGLGGLLHLFHLI